jgi:hypothetical protein
MVLFKQLFDSEKTFFQYAFYLHFSCDDELTFKVADNLDVREASRHRQRKHPNMKKRLSDFSLTVKLSQFTVLDIIVMLGQNSKVKTTMIRLLADALKSNEQIDVPKLNVLQAAEDNGQNSLQCVPITVPEAKGLPQARTITFIFRLGEGKII